MNGHQIGSAGGERSGDLRQLVFAMDLAGSGQLRIDGARPGGKQKLGQTAQTRREIPQVRDVRRFVGLAVTVTTVAAVEQGLPAYDPEKIHHFVLTRAAAEDVFRTLATETLEQRTTNPALEAERQAQFAEQQRQQEARQRADAERQAQIAAQQRQAQIAEQQRQQQEARARMEQEVRQRQDEQRRQFETQQRAQQEQERRAQVERAEADRAEREKAEQQKRRQMLQQQPMPQPPPMRR